MGQPKPGSQGPHVGARVEKGRQRHQLASQDWPSGEADSKALELSTIRKGEGTASSVVFWAGSRRAAPSRGGRDVE